LPQPPSAVTYKFLDDVPSIVVPPVAPHTLMVPPSPTPSMPPSPAPSAPPSPVPSSALAHALHT
jgi:hypothetical protein